MCSVLLASLIHSLLLTYPYTHIHTKSLTPICTARLTLPDYGNRLSPRKTADFSLKRRNVHIQHAGTERAEECPGRHQIVQPCWRNGHSFIAFSHVRCWVVGLSLKGFLCVCGQVSIGLEFVVESAYVACLIVCGSHNLGHTVWAWSHTANTSRSSSATQSSAPWGMWLWCPGLWSPLLSILTGSLGGFGSLCFILLILEASKDNL